MGLLGVIVGYAVASTDLTGITTGSSANNPPLPPSDSGQAQAPVTDPIQLFVDTAEAVGLDGDDFRTCVTSDKYAQKVQDEMSGGTSAGVSGTPGHFIIDNKTKKAIAVVGAVPISEFQSVIDGLMGKSVLPATAQEAKNVPAVDVSKEHVRGNPNASITIVEYSDFQCPFCQRDFATLNAILEQYGDDVNLVYRHYPLSFHQNAQKAAEASECAAELGGNDTFWEFHDAIFALPSIG